MARIGYARVSTGDQTAANQVTRLVGADCERVFTDEGVSGAKASRPEWDKCLAYLRPGDALVAVKLDRIGRSTRDLITVAQGLEQQGIDLVCLDQPIDTTTAVGKLFFVLLAAFAEFERALIQERTLDGLRRSGRKAGPKPRLSQQDVYWAQAQLAAPDGVSVSECARQLKVTRQTLYRALAAADGSLAS
jgi:DNA invertase Pin-like site-specific DNA recombinase